MSALQLMAVGILLTFPVNWLVFVVVALVERAHRGIKTLTDRRWLSFGIALLSTTFSLLAIALFGGFSFGAVGTALLITSPAFVLTAVNLVFLWLTWTERW